MRNDKTIMDNEQIKAVFDRHNRTILSGSGAELCDWCYGQNGEHEDDCILLALWNGMLHAQQLKIAHWVIRDLLIYMNLKGIPMPARLLGRARLTSTWRERHNSRGRSRTAGDDAS